jgi:hypothetical protein
MDGGSNDRLHGEGAKLRVMKEEEAELRKDTMPVIAVEGTE